LLKEAKVADLSMEKRAQIFVTHAIRILPEGVQYLIPQDPSDARRVHSL
jgi:hypothetical protein